MRELTIDQGPKLDARQRRMADLHSVLNILNVLSGELALLEEHPDIAGTVDFGALQGELASIGQEIEESDNLDRSLTRIRAAEDSIYAVTHLLLERIGDEAVQTEIRESIDNLQSVYRIVHRRLGELETRANNPDLWIEIEAQDFERQFREVFYAIEKNAKGRYRIFFNLARKTPGDYYIDLKIESARQAAPLWIPIRLIDVLRDLTANARKYTTPGGKVALAIFQSEDTIQILIEDSGCGIPEDELERVTDFGYRASNVRDRPTMGGGFGLTKAAWLVNHWGGTMSIASGEGEGTTVRLKIPNRLASEAPGWASSFSI